MLSENLEKSLLYSMSLASERKHEYATVEHFLLALVEDVEAASVLVACGAHLNEMRADLTMFIDKDLSGLVTNLPNDPKRTASFQRVVQLAITYVQATGRENVTSADALLALFSEHESHAVYFLHKQGVSRQIIEDFLGHWDRKTGVSVFVEPPPKLPVQGIGPHVEIDCEGVIKFPPPESLDQDGNYIPRLRALHPELCELARNLAVALGRGNAPHAVLCERVVSYANLIDQNLEGVDFRRLYSVGVRLANAAQATAQAILAGDLPQLGLAEQEQLSSLLTLHGPFILATAVGMEAVENEERYQRRPGEEREYRAEAAIIASALQNRPNLIAPEVAVEILNAVKEIGEGVNPERSAVVGRATVRNVTIAVVSGAIGSAVFSHVGIVVLGAGAAAAFVASLAVSETIKKTRWFQTITQALASSVDNTIDASTRETVNKLRSALSQHDQFVKENEQVLRHLAGKRKELEFLHHALDWLKRHSDKPTDVPKD